MAPGTVGGSAGKPEASVPASEVKMELDDANGVGSVSSNAVAEDWNSERRLVSALAMLQDMESKIHQLRTLVPDRLLAPLRPVVDQGNGGLYSTTPKSPQVLFDQLSQTAGDTMTEVDAFKDAWNRPEMKAIWDKVDKKIKEGGENNLHPSGLWERDYHLILKRLDKEDKQKQEQAKRETEQSERNRLTSVESGWIGIVDSFLATTKPGLTINVLASTGDVARFSVLLHSTSTLFLVHNNDLQNMNEWVVSMNTAGSMSKTIDGILTCINNRDRKWDLPYLLDMFQSYVDVKKVQCIHCNKLLDSDAQLPTTRKPKLLEFSNSKSTFAWEPYHPRCA